MLLHNEIVGTTLVMITSDIIIGKTGQEESYKKKRNQPEFRLCGDFDYYVLKSLKFDTTEKRSLTPAIKMGSLYRTPWIYMYLHELGETTKKQL